MPYKFTYIFGAAAQGFSESWYVTANSLQAADAVANGGFFTRRIALLGTGCQVDWIRTVDLNAPGSALLTNVVGNNAAPDANKIRDNASNCIQVRGIATGNYRRVTWLHCVPDNWIGYNADGSPFFQPPTQPAITALFQFAGTQGIGFRGINTDQTVNLPLTIKSVQEDMVLNSVQISLLVAPIIAYQVGQYIRLSKIKGDYLRSRPPLNQNLNGIWQIIAVDNTGTNITINSLWSDWNPEPVYFSGGISRTRFRYDNQPGGPFPFPTWLNGVIVRFARKKPGKAFFVPPGRQRALRRW